MEAFKEFRSLLRKQRSTQEMAGDDWLFQFGITKA